MPVNVILNGIPWIRMEYHRRMNPLVVRYLVETKEVVGTGLVVVVVVVPVASWLAFVAVLARLDLDYVRKQD